MDAKVVGCMSFEAYVGEKKFAFVAHSHTDDARICDFLNELDGNGSRIWYDRNGSVDQKNAMLIEERIENCEVFIVFASKTSIVNDIICNEIMYASKLGKPICFVCLDEIDSEQCQAGVGKILKKLEPVHFEEEKGIRRIKRILEGQGCNGVKEKPAASVAESVPTSEPSEVSVPVATEKPTETAQSTGETRSEIGSSQNSAAQQGGEGDSAVKKSSARTPDPFRPTDKSDKQQFVEIGGERIGVNERRLELKERGITNIGPLENMERLTVLILTGNGISDLSPLSGLSHLTTLNLSKNHIEDITPLSNLPHLTWLIISNNQISDITPLLKLQSLRNLYLNGNPISDEDKKRLKAALPKCSIVF